MFRGEFLRLLPRHTHTSSVRQTDRTRHGEKERKRKRQTTRYRLHACARRFGGVCYYGGCFTVSYSFTFVLYGLFVCVFTCVPQTLCHFGSHRALSFLCVYLFQSEGSLLHDMMLQAQGRHTSTKCDAVFSGERVGGVMCA